AMAMAFQHFTSPVNVVTDSAYVAGVVQRLDKVVLGHVTQEKLFGVLKLLWVEIQRRQHPYYVLHIKSHTSLPRFLVEGNARADELVSRGGPPAIVVACPDCQGQHVPHYYGTNPRGLRVLQIWQTDITHIGEFDRLKFVHVSIDTFSSVIIGTAHTRQSAKDVIRHWQQAFSVAGVPTQIKTDNGPAYVSGEVNAFLQSWGVTHVTTILHSPTGQGIVECAHGTLKRLLQKQ
ncbi:hypothetical protein N332_04891, partial [Mesitornis unicolor]